MKPKKISVRDARKKEKKKINYKPVIAIIIFMIAAAALYYVFIKLGIELGRLAEESAALIFNGVIS